MWLTIGMYESLTLGAERLAAGNERPACQLCAGRCLPSVRDGLSVDGKLFALPFYAEASITYYRKDLFKAAGLTMPERPTWTQIAEFAGKLTDKSKEQYGLCLRGKAGWGENMALITTLGNAYGARWFDEQWKPQFDQPEWKDALNFYVNTNETIWPAGRLEQRLQRKPRAVQQRQMCNLGRCQRCRFVRDRQEAKQGSRRRWLHLCTSRSHRQGLGMAVLVVSGDPDQRQKYR
ncbi:putative ABC transporter-binding protein [Pseudomonas coronafaciens]|nr:putative ABC transporter-binding protein [Pseudomonas coronafaciens]